jgi:hypothetical protein
MENNTAENLNTTGGDFEDPVFSGTDDTENSEEIFTRNDIPFMPILELIHNENEDGGKRAKK